MIGANRAAMLALPPVSPPTGFSSRVRRPRDYCVRAASNDYSVNTQAIGTLRGGPRGSGDGADQFRGTERRDPPAVLGQGPETITDPAHVGTADPGVRGPSG